MNEGKAANFTLHASSSAENGLRTELWRKGGREQGTRNNEGRREEMFNAQESTFKVQGRMSEE
ncbi:hypothetical protein SY85_08640 [Flavisolibacter tropicus]|uniref:Uncharacterized protein n=1 Tax=Flavisolibacter tropicus TaxID=1492898 RepID=A0A172TU47_9BACT|nr:hypothetical protein SY85_08640 [Flavisolibacter tropicus]